MAHILIIDDNDELRNIVKAAIEADGHTTATARDGVEGVQVFTDGRFDLIISDVFMPNKDGIQTIVEIREMDEEIPIITVSAGASFISASDTLDDACALGANEVLTKPFAISELRAAVARQLAGASAHTP